MKRNPQGFSLTELVLAMFVGTLASACATVFLLQALKGYCADETRLLLSRDARRLAQALEQSGSTAAFGLVYPTYGDWGTFSSYSTFSAHGISNGVVAYDHHVGPGQAGQAVVFFDETEDPATGTMAITRICGYYLDADATGSGPVRTFDITLPQPQTVDSPQNANPVVAWLPSVLLAGSQHAYPVIVPGAGVSSGAGPFFNVADRSVLVRASLAENPSAALPGSSCNFEYAVTPRG